MNDEIEIPSELSASWEAFSQEWLLDSPLGYSPSEVSQGLLTLKRLWPERIANIVTRPERGTAIVVPLIDVGLLLSTCESAQYFRQVLGRLKLGDRSAYSELVLVAALRKLRYTPRFEASAPASPDAQCDVDGVPISFEVYAPDRSVASQTQQQLVQRLQEAITRAVSGCRVEISIFDSFEESDIAASALAASTAPLGTWVPVGSWAHLRRVDKGNHLPPAFDGNGPTIVVAGDSTIQSASTAVVIRWEESDARAERAVEAKRAQLRDKCANVVVINTCAVGGVRDWPEAIAKLHGSDYVKIGAFVFFSQGIVGPPEAIRREWRTVVNSKAQFSIPYALVRSFESLDESHYSNVTPQPRLLMS